MININKCLIGLLLMIVCVEGTFILMYMYLYNAAYICVVYARSFEMNLLNNFTLFRYLQKP